MPLKPREPAPSLDVQTLDNGAWSLRESRPGSFTMVIVYRGLHCPICKAYLGELESKLLEFEKRGVTVVAVSADSRDRAEKARDEWGLRRLTIGYDLPLATARNWGLFVSRAIREGEPAEFVEPGFFLIKPDGTLFYTAVANAPWGRPPLDQMLRGIDVAVERRMPARGEA